MIGGAFRPIRERLAVTPLPFWRNHYQFNHPAAKSTQALGPERIGDLITNTVIPLALLYARTFKDRLVRERALQLFYAALPAAPNSITRLMDKHLLRRAVGFTSDSSQQGVIRRYRYSCLEERCAECAVGGVVHTVDFGDRNEGSSRP